MFQKLRDATVLLHGPRYSSNAAVSALLTNKRSLLFLRMNSNGTLLSVLAATGAASQKYAVYLLFLRAVAYVTGT